MVIAPHDHEKYATLMEQAQMRGFSAISQGDQEFMRKHRRNWSIAIKV